MANSLGRKEPRPIINRASRIPVFGRFRSKSTSGYFCCRPFSKFRAFLDRFKTDPRGVIFYRKSLRDLRLGVRFETVPERSKLVTEPTLKISYSKLVTFHNNNIGKNKRSVLGSLVGIRSLPTEFPIVYRRVFFDCVFFLSW